MRAEGFAMSRHDPFFQFPLCCLAYGETVERRLRDIVSYCCFDAGRKGHPRLRRGYGSRAIDNVVARPELPMDLDPADDSHVQLAVGMATLEVFEGTPDAVLAAHSRVTHFCAAMESKFGRFPFVRLKTDYLLESVAGGDTGTGMDYRRLAVLCAVYSAIGNKERPVLIRRERIAAAAMGYKSARHITPAALAEREDGARPLTTSQLRTTLDRLEADGHFARVQASRRRVYFSHRLSRDQMREKVFEMETRREERLRKNRREDRDLQTRIRAANETPRPLRTTADESPL